MKKMYKLLMYSLTENSSTNCTKFVYLAETSRDAIKGASRAVRHLRQEEPKTDTFIYGMLYKRHNGRNKYICHISPMKSGLYFQKV